MIIRINFSLAVGRSDHKCTRYSWLSVKFGWQHCCCQWKPLVDWREVPFTSMLHILLEVSILLATYPVGSTHDGWWDDLSYQGRNSLVHRVTLCKQRATFMLLILVVVKISIRKVQQEWRTNLAGMQVTFFETSCRVRCMKVACRCDSCLPMSWHFYQDKASIADSFFQQ